ncbi:substrate-binding and VWA domain-containing protein [Couchioplanes caeruleus]|uniref:VWA domain-containing protein n=1 Tax=Couchioplanes caeruleus TaxID=56438 RepID=UPI0020BE4C19|nr:substrate-binding domain-containing protein [Couchioplanes caeruleus]UQU63695.1 substrate-binding and VWA domain-containing protein [Couchioplanes caeruleus]
MAIVVVLVGSWLGYQQLADNDCSGQIRLNVAAATEIAPAVDRAAQQWSSNGAEVNGTCVAVTVTGVNPAAMASTIALKHGVTLTGLGAASKSGTIPDVWIADSTTWLMRLRSEASGFVPTDGKSIATSPVVVAMPEPVAQSVGWPDRKLGWGDLLKRMTTGNSLRTGIVNPTRDAAGLAGLLALGSSAGGGPQAKAQQVAALRALAAGSSSLRDDLMQKFPRSTDAADLASAVSAAPLSEEDVVAYNAEKPVVPLAALYLNPQPPSLDYPFAVMPEVDLTKSAAATGLREALQQPGFKDELAKVGLRAPDGTVGVGFASPIGAPKATPAATGAPTGTEGTAAAGLDAGSINQALGSWAAITLPGRALAVFDVSGSMKTKVPTAGNLSRAEVTRRAASQGLALFDDQWAVGTWIFSTEMDGKKPYKQIVPITPLTSGRSQLQASIGSIVPKDGGDTGLYDTALAAYKSVQDTWQAGRVNSVLLFTDGVNENKDGISRQTLINELKKTADPKRPVRMVIIGIGTGVDRNELEAITNATNAGGVFIAPDPAKISDIFLEAISSRSGAR